VTNCIHHFPRASDHGAQMQIGISSLSVRAGSPISGNFFVFCSLEAWHRHAFILVLERHLRIARREKAKAKRRTN
jgi:hypothetical protein